MSNATLTNPATMLIAESADHPVVADNKTAATLDAAMQWIDTMTEKIMTTFESLLNSPIEEQSADAFKPINQAILAVDRFTRLQTNRTRLATAQEKLKTTKQKNTTQPDHPETPDTINATNTPIANHQSNPTTNQTHPNSPTPSSPTSKPTSSTQPTSPTSSPPSNDPLADHLMQFLEKQNASKSPDLSQAPL